MLLIAAEADVRVPYTQSFEYLARLRERCNADSAEEEEEEDVSPPRMLHMRESGGHMGEGGRFRRLEQASLELAFLTYAVGE